MKKILVLSGLFLGILSFAQNKDNMHMKGQRPDKIKDFKEKMAKDLDLSKHQIKQINAIDDKYKSQEDSYKEQMKTLKDKIHQLRTQKREEVEKIFTEEQRQKLRTLKDKFHQKQQGRMHDEHMH